MENFLYRFRQRGPEALTDGRKYPPPRARKIGSDDIERRLLSKQVLQRWAHLSMRERAHKVLQTYNVLVSPWKLRSFYRLNDVST